MRPSFSAAILRRQSPIADVNQSIVGAELSLPPMKAQLLKAANEVILDQKLLVNVISRRVRQLSQGHRPLVEFAPGMGLADVALTEVISGKLTYESTLEKPADALPTVVPFVETTARPKKAA